MSQTILFVCATGIATSTAVTEKVMEYCKEHGLNVKPFYLSAPRVLPHPRQ